VKNYLNITHLSILSILLGISSLCHAAPGNNPHKTAPDLGSNPGKIYGKVINTIKTQNYTYIHVDTGKTKHWAASPPIILKKGAMVSFVPNMPMKDFTSKTLKRKFDVVYFVGKIYTDKASDHPAKIPLHPTATSASMKPITGIKKAINGNSIHEILSMKKKLAGKTIQVRGIVIKYTPKVMGKNWIHIQDSSSKKDLTVTTANTAKKGDIILVKGKLQLNKNFGFGYIYDVLLEDASITIE